LNIKNLDNSPSFLTITHMTLSARRFRSYRILTIDVAAEFCSRQNNSGTDLQFSVSDWLKLWQSQIPFTVLEKNSQLSDGLSNGSKRLAIYELRQSKTRPVTESAFLPDHTFLYKTGVFMKFRHDLPRNFVYKKCRRQTQLSAGFSYDSF
jgi:hypothetical protein